VRESHCQKTAKRKDKRRELTKISTFRDKTAKKKERVSGKTRSLEERRHVLGGKWRGHWNQGSEKVKQGHLRNRWGGEQFSWKRVLAYKGLGKSVVLRTFLLKEGEIMLVKKSPLNRQRKKQHAKAQAEKGIKRRGGELRRFLKGGAIATKKNPLEGGKKIHRDYGSGP